MGDHVNVETKIMRSGFKNKRFYPIPSLGKSTKAMLYFNDSVPLAVSWLQRLHNGGNNNVRATKICFQQMTKRSKNATGVHRMLFD